jgi:hypothetical protein
VLLRPKFVPADCSTKEGRLKGHRDSSGILLALAGETALEDKLDITDIVRSASGDNSSRGSSARRTIRSRTIDALVDHKFEGGAGAPPRPLGPVAQSRSPAFP